MKPAMPPPTRRGFILLLWLHPYRGTAPAKGFLDLESINVMVAT